MSQSSDHVPIQSLCSWGSASFPRTSRNPTPKLEPKAGSPLLASCVPGRPSPQPCPVAHAAGLTVWIGCPPLYQAGFLNQRFSHNSPSPALPGQLARLPFPAAQTVPRAHPHADRCGWAREPALLCSAD